MGPDENPRRRAAVIERSWLIAMSGACADWREVEARLVGLGYSDAARWLDDADLRQAIDPVCRRSREAFLLSSRSARPLQGSA